MGNFASSSLRCDTISVKIQAYDNGQEQVRSSSTTSSIAQCFHDAIHSIKTTFLSAYEEAFTSLSGASVVICELDEAWYAGFVADVNAVRCRCTCGCASAVPVEKEETAVFLGPSDTIVATIPSTKAVTSWLAARSKRTSYDDDTASTTTMDETDDESKCDFTDSEEDEEEESDEEDQDEGNSLCMATTGEVEYYAEDDDTVTKADRLLRLASISSLESCPIYVDDYLCPCGECPAYYKIACDVQETVTWRGVKEQSSITRVLQAFSTYNEVVGYHHEMIEAAEECLQLWLGDEDRALNSLVMLYDEVPQLCATGL